MKRIALTTLLILATTGGIALAQYPQYQNRGPTYYQSHGSQTYGSDGSSIQRYGNQSYINNGRGSTSVCTTYGNQTYCN